MKQARLKCATTLITALLLSHPAHAQNCSLPPQGAGDAWWQEFSAWCTACGGTPNSTDKSCGAWANWGRAISDAQSLPLPDATPPENEKPGPLTGQWSLTASCGSASETYAFNIEAVQDGALALSGGSWNCKLESGRLDGDRISMTCSNWLNKVDYQGTLISNNFMQGSFTQRLRAETCQWSALKSGTAAPAVPHAVQAGSATRGGNAPLGGDVFVGTITKGNFAKAGECPSST